MTARILIVDDEPAIRDVVATALSFQGHEVLQADDGYRALSLCGEERLDLIVLDVMMPGIDGYEVCRRLRAASNTTPIIFLTAKDETDDRIAGFVAGADDYLPKPFNIDELALRVTAVLRRTTPGDDGDVLRLSDLQLWPSAHRVVRAGATIELSPTEFGLLSYLLVNANTVLSKGQILANVWDHEYDGSDTVVETYISYLRRKIDDGHEPLIQTVRGVGYVLRESR